MKAALLYRDRDFDADAPAPAHEQDLIEDLGLHSIFDAMARGDEFLRDAAQRVLLTSLTDHDQITYRQEVLEDCLRRPEMVRELYDLVVQALQAPRNTHSWFLSADSPSSILHRSVAVLTLLVEHMESLHALSEEHAAQFSSEGFRTFFAMIARELDDEYLHEVRAHLRRLAFKHGVLMSAQLGSGNRGRNYLLRRANERRQGIRGRVAALTRRSGYSFRIADRDEAGFRALEELRGRGVNHAANATAQSVDHILGFFAMLRVELAFYIGALNLHETLLRKGKATCRPAHTGPGAPTLNATGLYDAGLALRSGEQVIGNDVDGIGRRLVVITGANQGGKSTFLRSVGLAQLMMQAGMFACAESFSADVREHLFTHFKREEDASMQSGKFDEELARMRGIADRLTPHSLVLCNESFSATNEREGSEIALQITRALLESGIKVIFVTHMYELATRMQETVGACALFLRAEREPDGTRSFRLHEGEPLATSYGIDLYNQIFTPPEPPGARDRSVTLAGRQPRAPAA